MLIPSDQAVGAGGAALDPDRARLRGATGRCLATQDILAIMAATRAIRLQGMVTHRHTVLHLVTATLHQAIRTRQVTATRLRRRLATHLPTDTLRQATHRRIECELDTAR